MTGINSQLGPVQQRLALSAQQVRQPIQYRNERLVSGGTPNGFLRSRRPVLANQPRTNSLQPFQGQNSLGEEQKPVTEENESGETPSFIPQQSYIPQIPQIQQIQTLQQQPQFKQQSLPSVLYTTDENGEILEHHRPIIDFSTTPRLLQQPNPEIIPTTLRTTQNVGSQRFILDQDRPIHSALQGTTKPPVSVFDLKSQPNSLVNDILIWKKTKVFKNVQCPMALSMSGKMY